MKDRKPTIDETMAYVNREWSNTLRVLDGDPRVDWTGERPKDPSYGGCALCFHQEPLHEPGCITLECRKLLSCGCRTCLIPPT